MPLRRCGSEGRAGVRRGFAAAAAALALVLACNGASSGEERQRPRHYWEQPGGDGSVWNRPLGRGAIWGDANDPDTQDLRHGGIINPANDLGHTVWVGRRNDPIFFLTGDPRVGNARAIVRLHLPAEVYAPGPHPGDNNAVYFDPVGHWGLVFSSGNPTVIHGRRITGGLTETDDATSDSFGEDQETGLMGHSTAAGLIRRYDLEQIERGGHMRHMLRYATDAKYLKDASVDGVQKLGPKSWPQAYEDYQEPGVNLYTGRLAAGTTIGIPITTPMPPGLTRGGQELFWTLQHYGALFRDQAGGGVHFCVDQESDGSDIVAGMRRDLPMIVQLLAPLRNQHVGGRPFATSPKNGPGRRVDTGPPPLARR